VTTRIAIALACFACLLAFPAGAAADEIEWMYDPDQVVEIRLGDISAEELDALEAEPDEYVKGSFELLVGGVPKGAALNDVGIRLKGGLGSGRPVKTGKSGFKVRFDEFVDDQLFFGIKRLTLNNMIQDPSMVHETLTYGLFHDLGLPASRTGYAFVKLNGSVYGLFLNLETLDELSLPQWFGEDNTGHLYEADAPGTDVTTGSAPNFEVDEGDDEDIGDLETLIEAVNDDEGDWTDNVSPFADLEEMTRAWAIERYVAHWDVYAGIAAPFRPNNYYLHSDLAGVFQTMPWGTDQTWEIEDVEFGEPAGGVMFNECLADASCRQLYLEGLSEVRCAVLDSDAAARAAQLAAMLDPYQDQEDETRRESSAEEIAEELEEVESFATVRPGWLEDFLVAEEVLGDGPDPCVEPEPEPENPFVQVRGQMPPPTEQPPPAEIGSISRKGKRLRVKVVSPMSGRLVLSAKAKGRRVCGNETNVGVGPATVSCRLTRAALKALKDSSLRLGVRVRFPAVGGSSASLFRRANLPRL
jgi:hypothetical protein